MSVKWIVDVVARATDSAVANRRLDNRRMGDNVAIASVNIALGIRLGIKRGNIANVASFVLMGISRSLRRGFHVITNDRAASRFKLVRTAYIAP